MRRIITLASVLALAAVVSGCAVVDRFTAHESVAEAALPGHVEPVHAVAIAQNQAVFWVSSNGCTRKEDLIPIVSIKGGDAIITLRRIDEDTCDKPSIRGVELKWSFEELGLAPGSPVSVNNPYQLPQT